MAKWQKGQSGNPAGRKPGSTSYKAMVQSAFIDIMESKMQVGKQTIPYYQAFLENLKVAALKPDSKAFQFIAERLLTENVLEEIDASLNKAKREDLDFLSYRIHKQCFDIQQKILLSKEKKIYLMAGRRAGKSEVIKKKIAEVLCLKPDSKVLYIGKTSFTAIEQIFNGIKDIIKDLSFEIDEERRNEGYIKLANTSELFIKGNTTTEDREKLRGFKWDLAIIDEVQSQKGLPYLINDIIEPALVDRAGQLILAGTGPRVAGTYWEELWKKNGPNTLCLNWNLTNNPFIPDHQNVLNKIKEEKGLTDSSPLFEREYLGKISYDMDALVFRLTPDNYYTDAELDAWINTQPITDIKFSAGLDYGWSDADGFAITMFSTTKPEKFLLYEYKGNRTGITELADKIREGINFINTRFSNIPDRHFYIYSDAGGAGKKISYELSTQYNLPCLDAYKVDKDFQVEMLQEEVRTGHLKVREGSPFADEALKTVFARNDRDELTRVIDDDVFHPDLMDAIRYSLSTIWVNYRK